jgi:hypothetical protein
VNGNDRNDDTDLPRYKQRINLLQLFWANPISGGVITLLRPTVTIIIRVVRHRVWVERVIVDLIRNSFITPCCCTTESYPTSCCDNIYLNIMRVSKSIPIFPKNVLKTPVGFVIRTGLFETQNSTRVIIANHVEVSRRLAEHIL